MVKSIKMKIKKMLVTVDACGDHSGKYCFIHFKNPKTVKSTTSESRDDCVLDYDKDGNLVGLELYEGFDLKKINKKTHKCPKCKAVNVCESMGDKHACRSCPNIWSEK
jgi:uncharacterized protein YuzE